MDIKAYTNDAVELLKELIAIPSVSRDETKAADCLSEYLNQWNLPHGREGNNRLAARIGITIAQR